MAACNENVIDGNYAHDNAGPGIEVEISTGNLVMNNITSANQNLRSGPFRDAAGKETIMLNSEQMIAPSRLFRPYHAGDGRGIYISSSPKTKVLHNTAFLNEGEGICVEGPPRSDGTRTVATGDYVVMNNISAFNHGSQLNVRPKEAGERNSGGVSDYNILFSVGAVFAKNGWDGASTFELSEWQKTSGQDSHSMDADPQFALAAMNDFRLLKSSPALQTESLCQKWTMIISDNRAGGKKLPSVRASRPQKITPNRLGQLRAVSCGRRWMPTSEMNPELFNHIPSQTTINDKRALLALHEANRAGPRQFRLPGDRIPSGRVAAGTCPRSRMLKDHFNRSETAQVCG